MQLSLSTEYAIHSLFYLAMQDKAKLTLVSDVAKAQNISESYLAKVFQTLSKAGLIKSYRGAKGGYLLAKEPNKISLRKIVETMEGNSPIYICDDHKRKCNLLGDCLISHVMTEAEEKMFEVLDQTSLADLLTNLNYEKSDNSNGKVVPFWGNGSNGSKE
jgi:Rrf2 family protein